MKHLSLTSELYEYMLDKSLREHPSLTGLRKVTSTMELANMQVAPEQAQFMQLLLRLIRAKNVLELGTFTGYSALAMSLMLPDDGKLITCDISTEWTSKAHPFWKEAKQDHKIELRLGRALDTLHDLIAEGWEQKFDFIFIDADKTNYVNYYELALKLIQPQGLIAIDNIFWDGKVIDENEKGGQTREIRKLNELIKNDQRVFISLLPIADGLFLVQPS
ncbi:class I SAM-dependent methyltransferase [Fluoribacter gormanii]|uniref:O-methyltransferase MSMEG_5073 n=1 Tax=Fluoribacter gormanii TaxID=464 RepID=A0A377GGG4_9GAMM|nr:class I SAM-dependent methyltransferase [Fluoribacter gormanii]KTD05305.1 O-methyltransferase [Fluoribacter gormanii]MCW8444626.1 class I SAM-dependent methyltransferase [Fluoribacter gormanii]MCW8469816.1 class I SAM-dependent methyltransferase [Fluoribacter gormanii]SIR84411.1 Predicted O-methyltransferase YrrM [Fluoribacter gormanii]STO23861.1 Putative O-methyltransferase MSMEG_5073 [Fluoribacter gormanii]